MPQRGQRSNRGRGHTVASGGPRRATPRKVGVGGEQVEGRRAVFELLRAKRRKIHEIWFDQDLDRTGIVAEIAELALQRGVPLVSVARGRFERAVASDASQGVVAFAQPLDDQPLGQLIRARSGLGNVVVLDHVSDPRNLGAILRSAECAGFIGAVLAERRATKVTPTVTKSAAGAIEYLRFSVVPGIPAALEELKELGMWIVGLDPSATTSIYDLDLLDAPVALVLGSEGKGLARLVRERCDALASIPQFGKIDSLNVSAAATVALFETSRRRRS